MKARITASLNEMAQTAFDDEVSRQLEERSKEWYENLDSIILYTLHNEFGFGKDRLLKFFRSLINTNEELISYYHLKDADFICKKKLKEIGVDVEEWNRMVREGEFNERPKEN